MLRAGIEVHLFQFKKRLTGLGRAGGMSGALFSASGGTAVAPLSFLATSICGLDIFKRGRRSGNYLELYFHNMKSKLRGFMELETECKI